MSEIAVVKELVELPVNCYAFLRRELLRYRISGLVEWSPLAEPEEGCTAIVGMCSRLPEVLAANLRCLDRFRWPGLRRVVVAVDCEESGLDEKFKREVVQSFPELQIQFVHYSSSQAAMAESLKLPYVYSWLSWCLALRLTVTRHVLIHDYDALILGPSLWQRYEVFQESGAKVQGITWYQGCGVDRADQLATTFEAFFDTVWLRQSHPLALFNKVRAANRRWFNFDTTLDMQYRLLAEHERTIMPMSLDDLVHPSQMIHQYTMFRRSPAMRLPCFSIPMIPFFMLLGGRAAAIDNATEALRGNDGHDVDLLNDGARFNLANLDRAQVDWLLKQMVQACVALSIPTGCGLRGYGSELYRVAGVGPEEVWRGDFTPLQRAWIDGK